MLHKIDPQLLFKVSSQSHEQGFVECIVFSNNYHFTKECLQKVVGSELVNEYPFIMAFGVKANFSQLINLADIKHVTYIGLNSKVKTLVGISKKVLKVPKTTLAYKKHVPYTIAVIDTGISPIIDFSIPQKRLVHFEDFINGKRLPYDDNGHGTFVSSVLAGNGLVSGGEFEGLVPNAFIVSLKALDENGETGALTILKAMQWVYDNRKKFNIKVVCMSFGSGVSIKRDPLIIGAEALWNAGVCVVCAAGNSGPEEESINSPGAANKIITVGALDDGRGKNEKNNSTFSVANFSSRGPALGNYKPDLLAPGVNVLGACSFSLHKKHYDTMSGTSVATPMIAGVCALLVGANPKITPNEVKKLLISNCKPLTKNRNEEGFGLLDCDFLNKFKIT